jgi:hypothetical protein
MTGRRPMTNGGKKVTEAVYAQITRLRREEHLGAEKIGDRLGLAKSTVQKTFARMDGEASSNGHGATPHTGIWTPDPAHVTTDSVG